MDAVLAWLLDGDPSIRWQVMTHLGSPADAIADERARVATEGWGAELVRRQDPEGTWAGGLYSPKWTSTTYTLLVLWWLGLDPAHPAGRRGVDRLFEGLSSIAGHPRSKRPEACITGMGVGLGAYFGADREAVDGAVSWLADNATPDGGWNCDAPRTGSRHGSFHTTIIVLEGLQELRRRRPDPTLDRLLDGGWRFLWRHRMHRSHRTGEVVDGRYLRFSYPPRWHYDLLRGLDHLADAGAPTDPAAAEAIEVVRERRRPDGRWLLQNRWPGKTWFEFEQVGRPSRWNTLRALRVLEWWEAGVERGA